MGAELVPAPGPRPPGFAVQAALALVLAMVGVFGILAYSVQQHVRDFGERKALIQTAIDAWGKVDIIVNTTSLFLFSSNHHHRIFLIL